MAHSPSSSIDRIREQRRARRRSAATILWAVLLALFVSGGNAFADHQPRGNATFPYCQHIGTLDQHTIYAAENANVGTPGVCPALVDVCPDEALNPGIQLSGTCIVAPTCGAGQHLENNVCVNDTPTCGAGQHLENNVCVNDTPTCGAGQHLENNVCVNDTPTCGAGQHLENNVCVNDTPTCGAGEHLENNVCVADAVTCDDGFHRDPQTNTCVANGQSNDDNGKAACEAAGGQWDAGVCTSAAELACAAAGGTWDGECFRWTNICHKAADGTYSILEVNAAAAEYADHMSHGDKLPENGACAPDPIDACPDDLNPGHQDAGPCKVASNTGSNTGDAGANPGSANAGGAAAPDNWVDPAVDVDRGNSPLAVGGAAAPDGGVGPEEVMGAAAGPDEADGIDDADADGAAAAPAAGGGDLPLTGMSPISTVLAGLLAVLFGAFAYGEAGRASRRAARARA